MSIDSIPSGLARVETARADESPGIARMLGANVLLQLAGMLAGQLLAFDAAVHLASSASGRAAWLVGLVGAAFNVTRLLAVPVAGRLCDTRGAERILVLSPLLGGIAVAAASATAIAGVRGPVGATVLVAARLLEGASAACAMPAMLTLLSRATEGRPAMRTRVMGMFEITALAGLVGAMLTAALLWERFDTNALAVLAPLYAAAIPLLALHARRSGSAPVESSDRALPQIPIGAAIRALFVKREHVLFAVVWTATNAMVGLWLQYMPYVFMIAKRTPDQRLVGALNGSGTSIMLGIVGALYVGGTALWSWAGANVRRERMLGIAVAATVVMSATLIAVNHGAPNGLEAITAICILLQGGITPAALALLADLTGEDDASRGTAMGVFSLLLGVGNFAGILLGAPLVARWQLDGVLGLTIAFALVSLVGLGILARTKARVVPARAQ